MFESIFEVTTDATIGTGNALISILSAILLGLVVSFTYAKCSKDAVSSKNFLLTLMILPGIIAMIILLVGSNVARAFSLAGAFSLVRFRSEPGDPKDIAYICIVMAIGLSNGMGYLTMSAVFTALLCLILFAYSLFDRATDKGVRYVKITVPEDLNYVDAFDDIFRQFASNFKLINVKTADLGTLFKLEYSVRLKNEDEEKEFIDQLRTRNGNMNISMLMGPRQSLR